MRLEIHEQSMKSRAALWTLVGFWTFFAFGFVDNLKGPLLPEIVRSGSINYAQAGSLIFANYLGFITATLSSGLLADRLSNRMVLWIAGWCLMVGLAGLGICNSFVALCICMIVMGLGLGAIELGANGLMIELHAADRGRYLNLLSVFHGCGSFMVPLMAARLIDTHWNWQTIYAICGLMALPMLVFFVPMRPTSSPNVDGKPQSLTPELRSSESQPLEPHSLEQPPLLTIGFTSTMWCYYVLIAAYVAVELSIGAWMMVYLQQTYTFTVDQSSQYLSMFFVMLMTGRLVGAWFVEKVDYLRAVAAALVATAVCIAMALTLRRQALFLLPISGLCMSIIFPTITASVSRLHPNRSGAIIGLLFGFSGLGGALGPWLVGLANQQLGVSHGLWLTLVFNAVALAALGWLRLRTQPRFPDVHHLAVVATYCKS